MTNLNEVYKCDICGNIVTVLHTGVGQLVCCGKPMVRQDERVEDTGSEKHVPVIEVVGDGVKVSVGSVAHPMVEKHYIEWIEVQDDKGKAARQFLVADQPPVANFNCPPEGLKARAYCNLHGLWKSS